MTFTHSPDLITTPISEDETVLLHLTTHRYYSLNETGQFIWDGLGEGKNPGEIVAAILDRWEANRADVEAYVAKLVGELRDERLLVPVEG